MHQVIAEKLRHRIADGAFPDGRVPPELVLMDDFQVSRHTIRAALQRLVTDGLIERRAGSGTDDYIGKCAIKKAPPSNLTRWKDVAINHHVMHVLDDLSTSGAAP